MSVNEISNVTTCNHSIHLFENPICKSLSTIEKVMNIAFHVLTLGVPYGVYKIISCFIPRKTESEVELPKLPQNLADSIDQLVDGKANTNVDRINQEEPVEVNCTEEELDEETFIARSLGSNITVEQVQEFTHRGGEINILEDHTNQEGYNWGSNRLYRLSKDDIYSVGCSSGMNRSQTMRAFLLDENCDVRSVLAGGDSAFNPDCDTHILNEFTPEEQEEFVNGLGYEKKPQLGADQFGGLHEDVDRIKRFYQDYFNNCEENHFITFAKSGPSVLVRLLAREGRLDGLKITHLPWPDEIMHIPENADYAPGSSDAYFDFYLKIDEHICVK